MNRFFIADSENYLTENDFILRLADTDLIQNIKCNNYFNDFVLKFCAFTINSINFTLLDENIIPSYNKIRQHLIHKDISNIDEISAYIKNSESQISIFTSGTTKEPKKISHKISSLASQSRISPKYANNVWGFCYNRSHMAGIQVLLQALLNGNPIVNLFAKARSDVFSDIEKYSITNLSATPTFYKMLLPCPKTFPHVNRITLGGERSDESIYKKLSEIFPSAKINNIYATTETGSLLAASDGTFAIPKNLEGKIVIRDGELLIDKSLLGESAQEILDGNFYHTGDITEPCGQEGKFRIIGRRANIVNVGGEKVNPEEIESAIAKMNGVKDVLVYGRKNSVTGNILCADIVLNDGTIQDEMYIKTELCKMLPKYKVPRIIKFTDRLTTTKTGKAKR